MRKIPLIVAVLAVFLTSCGGKAVTKKVDDPGVLYVQGVDQMKKKKYDNAIATFAKVRENYPFDPIAIVAQVKQADVYFDKKDYAMAASTYEDFVNSYPDDENAPYAMKRLAESYEKELPTIDRDQAITFKALERYIFLKNRYPSSTYSGDADIHIKSLNERLAAREFYVGEFYYKTGSYNASVKRLEFLLERFPDAKDKEKALYYLALDYKELDHPEKAEYYQDLLKEQFPKSNYIRPVSAGRKTIKAPERSSKKTPTASTAQVTTASPAATPSPTTIPVAKAAFEYSEKKRREIPLETPEVDQRQLVAAQKREPKAAEVKEAAKPASPTSTAVSSSSVENKPDAAAAVEKVDKVEENSGNSPAKKAGEKEDRLGFFSGKGPIEINGDMGESFEKGKVLTFKGNVIAKQFDPDPAQTFFLFCDRLTAHTTEDTKEIERAEADGNVKMVKQDKTATSKQAFYYSDKAKDKAQLILKGDVVIFLGSDKLSADTVTYFIDEDRFLVQGDKDKRAKATITPKK
jgi:outer membrane protein assembly factor BamD